ncbi:hypothetical protein CIRG_08912 [Coccidioides immitis RMSCC 2394]|uniref:Uncharacterized protein n=1 Tax=Coccidioides immitis RMSCC 2394 TaxID=404692 RepID=A0A0J6YKQ6_COCIT|nr:hypothetical protein CIRG_08912 [Coccidioides immitis RMSCC 2394]
MDVEDGKSVTERIAAIKEYSLQHSARCKWGSLYHTDSLPVDTKTRVVPVQGPPRSFFGKLSADVLNAARLRDLGWLRRFALLKIISSLWYDTLCLVKNT